MTTSRRLTAAFLDHISDQPPPDNSLFWKLWNKNKDIAEKALNTSYIQGIKNGTLSPENYGSYVVNDAYYCFKGGEDYDKAGKRTDDADLKDYLSKKAESFKKYNQDFVKKWHIKDAASVVPIKVTIDYAGLESKVATDPAYHPIYCLIVNLPCHYLWAWLAEQISSNNHPNNLYQFWINGNKDPNSSFKLGSYIDHWIKKHPGIVDEEKANDIYSKAMQYEFEGFNCF